MKIFPKTIFYTVSLGIALFLAPVASAQTMVEIPTASRFEVLAKNNARQFDLEIQERRDRLALQYQDSLGKMAGSLNQISDVKKRQLAKDIIEQFQQTNLSWTNDFAHTLSQLEMVVAKVKTEREKLYAQGKDVASLDFAIARADASLNIARKNLGNQVSKLYMPNIQKITAKTATADFRNQFSLTRDLLLSDFMSFRDTAMNDVRFKTALVLQEFLKMPNSN